MAALIGYVLRILAALYTLLQIVESIRSVLDVINRASKLWVTEPAPGSHTTALQNIDGAITNPETGLVPIHDVQASQGVDITDILDTVDLVKLAVDAIEPYVLPEDPPAEWAPTEPSAIWDQGYQVATPMRGQYQTTTGEMLLEAFSHSAIRSQWVGFAVPFHRDFSYHSNQALNMCLVNFPPFENLSGGLPNPVDWSAWVPGQSLVELLNSQSTALVWSYMAHDGITYPNPVAAYAVGELNCVWWQCDVADWELPLRSGKLGRFVSTGRVTPPAWPGIEAVELGTPVALSAGFTIHEPMDGVIVTITSVPKRIGNYAYDDVLSYVHAGSLSFYDDEGHHESAQGYSFVTHILTPRTMVAAAGVRVRTTTDVEGTVTPWTII